MISKLREFLKREFNIYKDLLRNIPGLVTGLFLVTVVAMNLLANKTIVNTKYVALDGGFTISWISFLLMDMVTKRFGPRAGTRLSIVATITNLGAAFVFWVVSKIGTYEGFDIIFGGVWFILLSSTIAFIVSAIVNNFLNHAIGKMFKKNPDGRIAYGFRSIGSTVIAQFIDNLIFAVLTFMVFAPIFWDGFSWTFIQCLGASFFGALAEIIGQVIFTPIGFRVVKKWGKDEVGKDFLEKYESSYL